MTDPLLRVSQWCYSGVWQMLTRWFCVPRLPPSLPASDGEVVATFRPSEGYLAYCKFFFWIGLTVIDVCLTAVWLLLFLYKPWLGLLITPFALLVIIAPDIIAYIAIHLRYDTTWYLISDRALRIRRGIWRIHETTLSFENIQNIRLHQGPVQRYFGFANLIVETAGGGSTAETENTSSSHVGILEGLDHAESIRNTMLARLKQCQSTGLGETTSNPTADSSRPLDLKLLREIRDITNRLAN